MKREASRMVVVRWTEAVREEVFAHVRAGYPEEACGIFVGHEKMILGVVCVKNEAVCEKKRVEYVISPREILRVDREARARGMEIVGYFHSHPDHRAVPSAVDRELAWEGVLYVIVGVRGGEVAEVRGWVLEGEGFREVGVEGAGRGA